MKTTRLLIAAFALVSAVTVGPSLAPAFAQETEAPPTRLQEAMRVLGSNFRIVRAQAADASKNASTLSALALMIQAIEVSRAEVPPKALTLPEAERVNFLADYEAAFVRLSELVTSLQTKITEGRNTEAPADVAEIQAFFRRAHELFQ